MISFPDHFSNQADRYASYRPVYPDTVGRYLAELAPRRHRAWDVGCGSGQFTRLLSTRFDVVIATDASDAQLAQAPPLANVEYRCAVAEESGMKADSVDLTVAAQAAHWFDIVAFYEEVRRIGRTRSIMALITYNLMRIDDQIDAIVDRFYGTDLAAYWPPERRHVENGYQSLPFPFEELEAPYFDLRAEWSLAQVLGYIETWSGVRALLRAGGRGSLDAVRRRLTEAWGAPEGIRSVRWPLALRVGTL